MPQASVHERRGTARDSICPGNDAHWEDHNEVIQGRVSLGVVDIRLGVCDHSIEAEPTLGVDAIRLRVDDPGINVDPGRMGLGVDVEKPWK